MESLESVTCHDEPSHVAIVSQSWTGDEPYSHWRPLGEHDILADGSCDGHAEGGPLSAQPAPQPPLLLLAPPPLPLPPPPLVLPLLPPPLLLLLPPPLLPPLPLPLPPPLVLPLLLPLPASLSVLNVDPPQANDIMASGTINVRLQRFGFMRFP